MRYSTMLKWLSPKETGLDISNLLLTAISGKSKLFNYRCHPLIHKFLSQTSLSCIPGLPAATSDSSAILASAQAAIPGQRLRVDVLNPSDNPPPKAGRPSKQPKAIHPGSAGTGSLAGLSELGPEAVAAVPRALVPGAAAAATPPLPSSRLSSDSFLSALMASGRCPEP